MIAAYSMWLTSVPDPWDCYNCRPEGQHVEHRATATPSGPGRYSLMSQMRGIIDAITNES